MAQRTAGPRKKWPALPSPALLTLGALAALGLFALPGLRVLPDWRGVDRLAHLSPAGDLGYAHRAEPSSLRPGGQASAPSDEQAARDARANAPEQKLMALPRLAACVDRKPCRDAMARLLADPDANIRIQSIEALAIARGPSAEALAREFLRRPSGSAREMIEGQATLIQTSAEGRARAEAVRTLRRLATDPTQSDTDRSQAIRQLVTHAGNDPQVRSLALEIAHTGQPALGAEIATRYLATQGRK